MLLQLLKLRNIYHDAGRYLRNRLSRAGDTEQGASLTEAVLWAAVAAALIVIIIGILNSWATGLMNNLPGVPGS